MTTSVVLAEILEPGPYTCGEIIHIKVIVTNTPPTPLPEGRVFIDNSIQGQPESDWESNLVDADGYTTTTVSVGPLYNGKYTFLITAGLQSPPFTIWGTYILPTITIAPSYDTITTINSISSVNMSAGGSGPIYVTTAGNCTCSSTNTNTGVQQNPLFLINVSVVNVTLGGPIPQGQVAIYANGLLVQGNTTLDAEGNAAIQCQGLLVGNYQLQAVYNPPNSFFGQNIHCFAPSASVLGALPWSGIHSIEAWYALVAIDPGYPHIVSVGDTLSYTFYIYRNGNPGNLSGLVQTFLGGFNIGSYTTATVISNVGVTYPFEGSYGICAIADPGVPGGGPDPISVTFTFPNWNRPGDPINNRTVNAPIRVDYFGGCWNLSVATGFADSLLAGVAEVPVIWVGTASGPYTPLI